MRINALHDHDKGRPMKNNNGNASTTEQADLAMKQVLQAEREAEQAVLRCEQEAGEMLKAAQQQAQHLAARTNERISRLQGRFEQKLNRAVSLIEQTGQKTERALADEPPDESRLGAIIEDLAEELSTFGNSVNGSEPDP
jgi:translation initiation factor 2 alpha subunit (eIF-2alpha)